MEGGGTRDDRTMGGVAFPKRDVGAAKLDGACGAGRGGLGNFANAKEEEKCSRDDVRDGIFQKVVGLALNGMNVFEDGDGEGNL